MDTLKKLKTYILHHATTKLSIRIQIAFLVIITPLLINTVLPTHVVFVRTPSIPVGFYLSNPITPKDLTLNSTVCFHAHPPQWIQERLYFGPPPTNVCKRIAALPHDSATLSINPSIPPSNTPAGVLPHLQITLTTSDQKTQTLPLLQYDSKHRPIPQQTIWEQPGLTSLPSSTPLTPLLPLNTPTPVPPSYYFLKGDIPNSLDSRYFGPIPGYLIYAVISPLWIL